MEKKNKVKRLYLDRTHKEAYMRGVYARLAGLGLEDRPYDTTSLYEQWLFGWVGAFMLLPEEDRTKQMEYTKNDEADKELNRIREVERDQRAALYVILKEKMRV